MEHRRDELAPDAGTEAAAATASAPAHPGAVARALSAAGTGTLSPAEVIALQSTAGNTAVLRLMSGREHHGIRNEPPASTPTSAASPLDVDPPAGGEDEGLVVGGGGGGPGGGGPARGAPRPPGGAPRP